MQDDKIVELYWQRDETAIRETERKYGRYLLKIAHNVLADAQDDKECVNDTYLKAWYSMPPHKPCVLATYLGKITRQVSIDLFRKRNREKRKASEYALSLDELTECVSDGDQTAEAIDLQLLAEAIERYLRQLSPEARIAFVGRYYYLDSLRGIAGYSGMSESALKSLLYRTRKGLKDHLEQEGFEV